MLEIIKHVSTQKSAGDTHVLPDIIISKFSLCGLWKLLLRFLHSAHIPSGIISSVFIYKYYLAFENSICEDYVTEKLFRLYNTNFNIIPVVRGALNVKELLPPNTFISTLDYKSYSEVSWRYARFTRHHYF
jgi:hypothetical protein